MRYETVHVQHLDQPPNRGQKRKLIQEGRVQGILARKNADPLMLTMDREELTKAMHHTGVGGVLQLVEPDSKITSLGLVRELQWHPITKKTTHASFQEVSANQVVEANVPLIFVGEPASLKDKSGELIKQNESISIKGKVTNLPDYIGIDISHLMIGDVISAGDIVVPDGCEAAHPDTVICSLVQHHVIEITEPSAEEVEAAEVPTVAESQAASQETEEE